MSLSDLKRYAFINAKLRSRIGGMLDEHQLESLLQSQSLEELFHHCQGSVYEQLGPLFNETGDIERLESWLFSRTVDLHKEVASLIEGSHALVVSALNRKLEVENLKGVLRLWFSNRIKGMNIDYRYGYLYHKHIVSDIDWAAVINAEDVDSLKETLAHTPYADDMNEMKKEDLTSEGMFFLETALDRRWMLLLRDVVTHLPKKDRLLVEEVLNRDADLKNIINLVRFGYVYNVEAAKLRSLMLPGGRLLKTEEFEEFVQAPVEKRSLVHLVGKLFIDLAKELTSLTNPTAEEQASTVEAYLFRVRKKSYQKMLRGYPFNFGIIFAYFFLEERQNTMIRTIINGIHYGWKSEKLREFAL
ncbi:MAG: V-type ATPase subunit [Sphaerochaetaceae bacterium]|jgi:V/A-type H+-transporting ATPase subunit C